MWGSCAQIMEARSGLPIIGMEQEIVEVVGQHDVVVLCGETGCGKTTQARLVAAPADLAHWDPGCSC